MRGDWKRGHWARGEGGALPEPLPGPGEEPDDVDGDGEPDDMGEIDLDAPAGWGRPVEEPLEGSGPPPGREWWEFPSEPPEPPEDDPPPAKIGKGRKAPGAPPKVSAAVRRDIHAKIRFIAVPVCQLWEMRDPLCGGAAVRAEPDASAAFCDIVLQSPDLIALFTGPASAFMIYVRLLFALLPVFQTIYAHHVSHVIELPDRGEPEHVDPARYAA